MPANGKLLSRGGIAACAFICSAFYLFVSNTGLTSLTSFKVLIFCVLGTLVAALVIGMSADLFQRRFGEILWKSFSNPLSPQAVRKINATGTVILMVWQIIITVLFAKLAYAWFMIYLAI
jgi:hypothetical protein